MPVVVITQEETETSSAALGKKLNLKELRLANAELLKEFFGVDKDSCACDCFSDKLLVYADCDGARCSFNNVICLCTCSVPTRTRPTNIPKSCSARHLPRLLRRALRRTRIRVGPHHLPQGLRHRGVSMQIVIWGREDI